MSQVWPDLVQDGESTVHRSLRLMAEKLRGDHAMADKPKTVSVEALQWHTYNGKEYQVGDTYDIDEQLADSVATQGKAVRVDRAEVAKQQAKTAKSKPVEPIGTTSKSGKALTKPRKARK